MDKKKILIVSRSFFPENTPRSFRTTELAKEFALQKHDVTVITHKKNRVHDTFEKAYNITIKDLGRPRLKLFSFGKSRIGNLITKGLNRLLQLAFEYPNIELMFLVKNALKNEEGYDLLISIAMPYPVHWGVSLVRTEKKPIAKTWVADCGDPFMGEATDTFRRWFYFKYVEKWFMQKTDFVTIPVKNSINAYYPEFHSKIRIIPQGFKIERKQKAEIYKPNSIPHFAFAGNFNLGNRDPRPFLEYLSTLETDFRFIIYSKRIEIIEPYLSRLRGKMTILDVIPRDELLPKLSGMDFLINFDNNSVVQLPSKLIDYAICNRPVLNITKKLDKNEVLEFLAGDYKHAMQLGSIDSYRIENVCAAFLKLTNEQNIKN